MNHHPIDNLITTALRSRGRITALTGAGISAESGIPTFRGPEGYWTVGSTVYHPQEMATYAMFCQNPKAVWQWYLYRWGVCLSAQPNAGHAALVTLERALGDRFALITQNVDNLHLRAGHRIGSTYQIHGNIGYVRCAAECHREIRPMPDGISPKKRHQDISETEWYRLHCDRCGGLLRPHVLWFDETYNEAYYHLESAWSVARHTALLVVVGTSGGTTLPSQVVHEVVGHNGIIIDINIEPTVFSHTAEAHRMGYTIRQQSSAALPRIAERIIRLFSETAPG